MHSIIHTPSPLHVLIWGKQLKFPRICFNFVFDLGDQGIVLAERGGSCAKLRRLLSFVSRFHQKVTYL